MSKKASLISIGNSSNLKIFRSFQSRANSKKKISSKLIKLPDPTPRYSIQTCIQRLDCLILRNVPLSKSCALQIKYYLIGDKPDPAGEGYILSRKHTEQTPDNSLKENLYCKSILPTDSPISWKKKEDGAHRSLRKRTLGLKKQSRCQQQELITNLSSLQRQAQALRDQLVQKEGILATLKKNMQQLATKQQELHFLLRQTTIQKLEQQQDLESQITKKTMQFEQAQQQIAVMEQFLKERQAEIFYFWQTQLQRS